MDQRAGKVCNGGIVMLLCANFNEFKNNWQAVNRLLMGGKDNE